MFLGLSLCVFGYNRAYHLPSSVGETRTKSDQTNLELQLDASELNEMDLLLRLNIMERERRGTKRLVNHN